MLPFVYSKYLTDVKLSKTVVKNTEYTIMQPKCFNEHYTNKGFLKQQQQQQQQYSEF